MIILPLGFTFGPALRYGGWLVLILGFWVFLFNPWFAPLFWCAGVLLSFGKNQLEIKPEEQLYRSCTSLFGLRRGKWQSFETYPYLAIIKKRISMVANSRMANQPIKTAEDDYYDLILLNENHRKKILLRRFKNSNEAQGEAEYLSKQLARPVVKYAPVISAQSRARRR